MSTILKHPLPPLTPKPQAWTELGIIGCFSWENESQFIDDTISIVKPESILEVGFFAGASSFMWLHLSKAKLTSVDPMVNLYDINEKHTGSLENVDRLKAYFGPERFRFIQKDSKVVRPDLDASYDLMFIDGDHWDQGIRNDFDIALEKKIPWVLVDDFVTSVEQVYFQSYQQYYDIIRVYPRKDQFMGKSIPIVLLKLKDTYMKDANMQPKNAYYEHFKNSFGTRDEVYQTILNQFQRPISILEIGVARDLGLYTRDSDGWSSVHFAQHIAQYGGKLDLVDIDPKSIENCKKLTEGFTNVSYRVADGIQLLQNLTEYYDIINLDAGDDPFLTLVMYNLAKSLNPKAIIIDDFHAKGALIPHEDVKIKHWPNGHEVAWRISL
jgi:predicted O-methyltransferase YrrM